MNNKLFGTIFIGVIISFFALFFVGIAFEPHSWGFHNYTWNGDGDNFFTDYGECRSKSLLGGYGSPDVDKQTLESLMRGRGWRLKCGVCEEWK